MKIGIIGANGRLGTKITKQALERGFEVKGIIYDGEVPFEKVELLHKSVFDLSKEDVEDIDALISAFGGGFHTDPKINAQVFEKYAEIMELTHKRMIVIGGAGSLFTDSTREQREYQQEGYSKTLAAISENICKGIQFLKNTKKLEYTVVCPSRKFDFEGQHTGKYKIGESEELLFNSNGESYVTYEDLAQAMLDIAQSNQYNQQVVTVLTDK